MYSIYHFYMKKLHTVHLNYDKLNQSTGNLPLNTQTYKNKMFFLL